MRTRAKELKGNTAIVELYMYCSGCRKETLIGFTTKSAMLIKDRKNRIKKILDSNDHLSLLERRRLERLLGYLNELEDRRQMGL